MTLQPFDRFWRSLRRRPLAGALCVVLALPAGCAATYKDSRSKVPADLPARVELAEVPFFPQEAYQCGPAALAMALAWNGDPVRPEDLVPHVYSPARRGSLPTDMITAARRRARLAYPVSGLDGLLREVAAGNPVIVLQDEGVSGRSQWHYAVVFGYDREAGSILLRSGSESRRVLSLSRFEHTWKPGGSWALVVLPPTRLPATAEEAPVLEAAVGLERARHWQAAAQAYGAALARWPTSLGALMGLGNSRYALSDLIGAERAFREAVTAHPGSAPALNNLAQVLGELGRRDEAVMRSLRAVSLRPSEAGPYRTTLAELLADP